MLYRKIIITIILLFMIGADIVAENVKSGTGALTAVTTGDENTALGGYTLKSLTTGHGNTGLGAYAGQSVLTVNGGVYLGYGAGYGNTSAHKLYIQTIFYPALGIFGDFSTGYFGINNSNPAVALDVTGAITSSGTITGAILVGAISHGTPWDMADGQYTGEIVHGQAGEALIYGDLVRQHTDGKYYKTDADSLITMDRYPRLALATISANAYGIMLIEGFICESDWSFATVGGALYTSTTTGAMTQTAPSEVGDRVQVVGKLEVIDIVYFDPEHSWLEI